MFTGLIRHIGTVRRKARRGEIVLLTIACGTLEQSWRGDSIAVNGVCLTVTDSGKSSFNAECHYATLEKTTLGGLAAGDKVHLEPALMASDALHGHLVQGHIQEVVSFRQFRRIRDGLEMTFSLPPEWINELVPEGSVALNGVSLTISRRTKADFSIQIITETLESTLLGTLRPGDEVNLETDIVSRTTAYAVGRQINQNINYEKLEQWGYV